MPHSGGAPGERAFTHLTSPGNRSYSDWEKDAQENGNTLRRDFNVLN